MLCAVVVSAILSIITYFIFFHETAYAVVGESGDSSLTFGPKTTLEVFDTESGFISVFDANGTVLRKFRDRNAHYVYVMSTDHVYLCPAIGKPIRVCNEGARLTVASGRVCNRKGYSTVCVRRFGKTLHIRASSWSPIFDVLASHRTPIA